MTKNERTARGLLEIKAELSESATVGELIRAWTAYLDEQDLVIPMNYKEAAREIDIALFRDNRDDLMKMPPGQRRFLISTKLKELLTVDGEAIP